MDDPPSFLISEEETPHPVRGVLYPTWTSPYMIMVQGEEEDPLK